MAEKTTSEKLLLIWESEFVKLPGGRVELIARQPVKDMSARQAGKVLGVSARVVRDLYRSGHIKGHKPGMKGIRRDGRSSNAVIRLDAASVLAHAAWVKAATRPF